MAKETKLKGGVLGVLGVASMGAVMMSPALGIYGNFGPMALTAGKATPEVVFFVLTTYIFVSIANPVIYLRFHKEKFNFFWNGVIPFIALIINLYLLYKAFFVEYWKGDWAMGKTVIMFAMIWMILGFIYLIILKKYSPALFKNQALYLREI